MSYCSRDDMINRFGEVEILQLTDRKNLGSIDDVVLDLAINDASAEVDSYLGKYTLPLINIPTTLVRISCDIARYRLYDDILDDRSPWVIRYHDALRFLKMVAQGLVSIGVDNMGASPPSNDMAVMQSGGRVFSREDTGFI